MPRAVQRATAADVPYSMSSGCATTQSTRWKDSSGRAGIVMSAILPRWGPAVRRLDVPLSLAIGPRARGEGEEDLEAGDGGGVPQLAGRVDHTAVSISVAATHAGTTRGE